MAYAPTGTILQHLCNRMHAETTADVTDAQLLERFATQRDEAALLALMVRHGPLVYGLCQRILKHTQDAEDAFQATFLVLARSAAAVRKREALGSWLYGVAYRIARKAAHAARRRRDLERRLHDMPRREPNIDMALRELPASLDEEVNRLPAKFRSAFVLCCLEGKSREEAAAALGWKKGTLASRLAHARSLLQDRLVRRGLTLPAALTVLAVTADASLAVPALLEMTTLRAAVAFSSRLTATAVSARAATLAQEAPRARLMARLVRWIALVAGVVLLPAAVGLAAHHALLPPDMEAAPPVVAAQDPEKPVVRKDRYGDALPDGVVRRFGTLRLRDAHGVACSPDGKHIVTGSTASGNHVVFWDRHTAQETRRLPVDIHVLGLQFAPDGQTLVAMLGTVFTNPAWDVKSGKVRFQFKGESGTFTADGRRLLTVYTSNNARAVGAWDVATGKALGEWAMPEDARSVCCSPDGRTVAYGLEDALVLYDLAAKAEARRLRDTRPKNGPMGPPEFTFSPDGKRVAMASVRGLRVWNVATGAEEYAWNSLVDCPVCFSADGKQMAWTGYDRRSISYAWILDIGAKEPRRLGLPINNLSSQMTFAPDGTVLAVMSDAHALELRDTVTGKDALPLDAHAGRLFGLELSLDGKNLATSDHFRVLVWDPVTGALRRRFPDEGAAAAPDFQPTMWDVRMTADGQLRHGNASNTHGHWVELGYLALPRLQKLNLKDGSRPAFADKDLAIHDVLESSGGRYLAVRMASQRPGGFDPTARPIIRIWDRRTGLPLDHLRLTGDVAKGTASDQQLGAFSPDQRLLVTTTPTGTIHLWELATGQERLRLRGHLKGAVRALLFSPDHRFLFTGGDDSQVLQWDLTGRAIDGVWRTVHHDAKQRLHLWNRLASADGAAVHKALWELAADPDGTVAFLQTKLAPVARADDKATAALIARLDSDNFAEREQAEAGLSKLGEAAVPAMRQALTAPRSLEQRRRLEKLVRDQTLPALAGDALRSLRAVEVLERIATPGARDVLGNLAKGLPDAWLTRATEESLERLSRRHATSSAEPDASARDLRSLAYASGSARGDAAAEPDA